jgi:hypothetical protein
MERKIFFFGESPGKEKAIYSKRVVILHNNIKNLHFILIYRVIPDINQPF